MKNIEKLQMKGVYMYQKNRYFVKKHARKNFHDKIYPM